MTHQEKLEVMCRHMALLGVPKSTSAPPAWRILWRLGIEVPPPLFVPFVPNALAMGIFFGLCWGLLMWAFLWARQGMPISLIAVASLAAGALFGSIMAAYFWRLARKHRLPRWNQYTGEP
jgi:membrane associated rhomboid family serine protease